MEVDCKLFVNTRRMSPGIEASSSKILTWGFFEIASFRYAFELVFFLDHFALLACSGGSKLQSV